MYVIIILIIIYGAPSHKSPEYLQRQYAHFISHTHARARMHTHTHIHPTHTHTYTPTHTHTPPHTHTCITGNGLVQWEENNRSVCRGEEMGFQLAMLRDLKRAKAKQRLTEFLRVSLPSGQIICGQQEVLGHQPTTHLRQRIKREELCQDLFGFQTHCTAVLWKWQPKKVLSAKRQQSDMIHTNDILIYLLVAKAVMTLWFMIMHHRTKRDPRRLSSSRDLPDKSLAAWTGKHSTWSFQYCTHP